MRAVLVKVLTLVIELTINLVKLVSDSQESESPVTDGVIIVPLDYSASSKVVAFHSSEEVKVSTEIVVLQLKLSYSFNIV